MGAVKRSRLPASKRVALHYAAERAVADKSCSREGPLFALLRTLNTARQEFKRTQASLHAAQHAAATCGTNTFGCMACQYLSRSPVRTMAPFATMPP